jgi:two-component system, cell cycle response regulator DivK
MTRDEPAGGTILVVEDNIDTRLVMSLTLQQAGYYVVTAANGDEAMKVAGHALPDLIIMDLDMPQREGFATTRRILQHAELRDVAVVAVTAYDTDGMRQSARDAGCSGYLSKPIDFEHLDRMLRQILHGLEHGQFIESAPEKK